MQSLPAAPLLPPPTGGVVDLLVVAGEHSGDEHAARLVHELRALRPGLRVCAIGGPRLASAGAQLLHDLTITSVVGLVEVLKHYGYFRALFQETVRWVGEHQPRQVLLVDYPGFNLRLAKALAEAGISRLGGGKVGVRAYIGPQIWAWKAGRRHSMAKVLEALAVIFPFEVACYRDTSLAVDFVGHPFVAPGETLPVRYGAGAPVLLLPGSRRQPVARIFPALLAAWRLYRQRHSAAEAVVLHPSSGPVLAEIQRHLPTAAATDFGLVLRPVDEGAEASAVLTSSGTMSLACALAGLPGAIAYRAHPLTYAIGRRVIKIPYLGIANILLLRAAWPEYVQGAATASRLSAALEAAQTPAAVAQAQADAAELRRILSAPAERNAAQWVAEALAQ